jgi:hypothetical protein
MTKAEIQTKFPDEWVLVGDPVFDEHRHMVGGDVLCHSKDRDEVLRRGLNLKL